MTQIKKENQSAFLKSLGFMGRNIIAAMEDGQEDGANILTAMCDDGRVARVRVRFDICAPSEVTSSTTIS
tara:strand:- start:8 stop:217 length:210 start_codon:yes stop_codon:yes gene_type:complete